LKRRLAERREQLGRAAAAERRVRCRRVQVGEWLQHKGALGHARVWQFELERRGAARLGSRLGLLMQHGISVEHNVEVDLSRAPPLAIASSNLMLDTLERRQQLARRKRRAHRACRVQEGRLVGHIGRCALVERRGALHGAEAAECAQRARDVAGAVAEVAAERDRRRRAHTSRRQVPACCSIPVLEA